MALFFTLAALYTLGVSRLYLYVRVQSSPPRFTLRLFALGALYILRPRRKRLGARPKPARPRATQTRSLLRSAAAPAWALLRRTQLHGLRVRLHSPDAARAALLSGAMTGAEGMLRAACRDVSCLCRLAPAAFWAEGILSLSLGQIMWAALKTGAGYAKRRLLQWKSTQSKAS